MKTTLTHFQWGLDMKCLFCVYLFFVAMMPAVLEQLPVALHEMPHQPSFAHTSPLFLAALISTFITFAKIQPTLRRVNIYFTPLKKMS
jgi:hypothetical protein